MAGDKLIYAFLQFLKLQKVTINRIDEAALNESDNPIEYLAETQGVFADFFTLEGDWTKYDVGDFIGFLEESEEPVIIRKGVHYYKIIDPQTLKERRFDKQKDRLKDTALGIIPLHADEIKSGMKLVEWSILKQKGELAMFSVMTLIVAFLTLIIPRCIELVIDVILVAKDYSNLLVMCVTMSLTIASILLINIVVNRSKVRLQANSRRLVISTVLSKIMSINVADESLIRNELIATFMPFVSSVDSIIEALLSVSVYLAETIVLVIMVLGNGYGYSRLFIPLFAVAMVVFSILLVISYKVTTAKRKTQATLDLSKKEMMGNIETIKYYNIVDKIFNKFVVAYDNNIDNSIALNGIGQWQGLWLTMFSGLSIMLLFAYEAVRKTGDAGEISYVSSSITLAVGYLGMLLTFVGKFIQNVPYLKLADKILLFEDEGECEQGYTGEVSGEIELINVSFAYNDHSNTVIKNLSLKIEPGEYIGVVGASGCGKSTLVKLLMGFVKPSSGTVTYDGVDINRFDLRFLRKQFGVVLQNAEVISGSIKSNIGMSPAPDMEMVEQAAKCANIYDDIMAMPMKFNTMISSESEVISGGQKQRIVLARALMNNPKILILDEATSAMDNKTQAVVKDNLDKMEITRIAIAHRLSTIEDCDRIIVMDKGSIVEMGTFDELMAQRGLFYRMASRNL